MSFQIHKNGYQNSFLISGKSNCVYARHTKNLVANLSCLDSVIEAPFFLDTFSSDRSHMYDRKTKKWNSPPPPYACIQIGNENNTAEYFTISAEDVKDDDAKVENCGFGAVLSLSQLKNRFHVT
jgi:hypothetical protein